MLKAPTSHPEDPVPLSPCKGKASGTAVFTRKRDKSHKKVDIRGEPQWPGAILLNTDGVYRGTFSLAVTAP